MHVYWRRTEEAVVGAFNLAMLRLPKQSKLQQERPRFRDNLFVGVDGAPLVAKINQPNPLAACERVLELLGGIKRLALADKTVLIKPNFNSPHPYPATTDPVVLVWLIDCLRRQGAARVIVGESSGAPWWPTQKVLAKLGVFEAVAKAGGEVVIFEDRDEWVQVATGGQYFPFVIIPRLIFEVDLLIYLSLVKTHRYARMSGALKLAVGFLHPAQRRVLHWSHLAEKIIDLNRACLPDLVIADCRETFVTEGPTTGFKVAPGIVLASGSPVAIDYEGVQILRNYQARNLLTDSPGKLPFLRYAMTTELTPHNDQYHVVE